MRLSGGTSTGSIRGAWSTLSVHAAQGRGARGAHAVAEEQQNTGEDREGDELEYKADHDDLGAGKYTT